MTMFTEMKFTDVRNNFTSVIDRVQNLSPVVVKPRKKSETYTFLLNKEWVKQLLQEVKIKVNMYPEEDGSLTLGIDELELYANGDTKEKAFEELTEDLIQYAQDYMNEPHRYYNAPNRRHHLSYLFKILLCNNKDEVKQMLLENAEIQGS